jgi:hypothetical protein
MPQDISMPAMELLLLEELMGVIGAKYNIITIHQVIACSSSAAVVV